MTDPTICGATWQDAAGYTHTCDRRPHGIEHLHGENSGEAATGTVTTGTVDYDAWAQAEAGDPKPIPNCGACGKPVTEGQHPGCYTTNVPDESVQELRAWVEAEASEGGQAIRFIDPAVTGGFDATPAGFAAMQERVTELRTTRELFPTVEEVGAKAIEMFKHDPNWWRHTFPLELASIIDRWLEAHGQPIAKAIKAGTRVRLRTVNGGDTICELATDYRTGQGCEFRQIADDGTVTFRRWYRTAEDIISVDIAAPRNGLDRCRCGSKYWDGQDCDDCGERWLGISYWDVQA